jgi:hypothetical protein
MKFYSRGSTEDGGTHHIIGMLMRTCMYVEQNRFIPILSFRLKTLEHQ